MKIVFFGTPEFAAANLQYLIDEKDKKVIEHKTTLKL